MISAINIEVIKLNAPIICISNIPFLSFGQKGTVPMKNKASKINDNPIKWKFNLIEYLGL